MESDIRVTMLPEKPFSIGRLIAHLHSFFPERKLDLGAIFLPLNESCKSVWFVCEVSRDGDYLVRAFESRIMSKTLCRYRSEGNVSISVSPCSRVPWRLSLKIDKMEFLNVDGREFEETFLSTQIEYLEFRTYPVVQPSAMGIYQRGSPSFPFEEEFGKLKETCEEVKRFFYGFDDLLVAAFHGEEYTFEYVHGINRLYSIPYNTIVLEKNRVPSKLLVELECPGELARQFVKSYDNGVRKPFYLTSWEYNSTKDRLEKVRDFLTLMNKELKNIRPGFKTLELKDVDFSEEELVEARKEGYQKYWPELFL